MILVIRAKHCFLSQISEYATDERIDGLFCVLRKPANFCHPGVGLGDVHFSKRCNILNDAMFR